MRKYVLIEYEVGPESDDAGYEVSRTTLPGSTLVTALTRHLFRKTDGRTKAGRKVAELMAVVSIESHVPNDLPGLYCAVCGEEALLEVGEGDDITPFCINHYADWLVKVREAIDESA